MSYLIDILLNVALLSGAALTLLSPYIWGGRLVLCQTVLIGIGAYTIGFLVVVCGYSTLVAFVLAVALGGAFGFIMALGLRSLSDAVFTVATFLIALAGLEAFKNLDNITGGFVGIGGLSSTPTAAFAGSPKLTVSALLGLFCALMVLLQHAIYETAFGRSIRALREDYLGAHLDGVNSWKVERDVYILFGIQNAILGGLWSFSLPRIVPGYFDVMNLGLLAILACIIAGSEKPFRLIIGAVIVVAMKESTEYLPVGPELRGHLPLLLVGSLYILISLLPEPLWHRPLDRKNARLASQEADIFSET